MPATATAQSEVGVFGMREPRRSCSVVSRGNTVVAKHALRAQGVGNALRSARGVYSENTNPNTMPFGTATHCRPGLGKLHAYASNSQQSALTDITNVGGPRPAQLDKVTMSANSDLLARRQPQPPPPPPAAPPAADYGSTMIEEVDKSNVQNAAEYASDFYNTLFRDESLFLPRPDYMDSQADITPKMRNILIDWLIEVHMKYKLRSETLYLTINLIDRYLTRMPVIRKRLQLVGVVAMFIAAKFEEINPPEIHDWVYITDNAYTKEDVLIMECTMLTTLSFQVMVPTAAHFFEGLAKANCCDGVHHDLAQYILELGLLDIRMLQHAPSHMVSAALLLSNELLERSPAWPPSMVQHSRHTVSALRSCVTELRQLLEAEKAAGGQLQAVRKKYSVPQRHCVSEMTF